MNEFITYIKEYSEVLQKCAVWHNTGEILAPVTGVVEHDSSADNYVYEFYCYIKIMEDLKHSYDIAFIEGEGKFRFKFPQAAALKKGKPRFHAIQDGKVKFQICAGTKIDCEISSEENHPDISFQIPEATDEPSQNDLILIMDAKYRENPDKRLPKDEIYKFGQIVDLFDLRKEISIDIKFSQYALFNKHCLITNGKSYSNEGDIRLLNKLFFKEVETFSPSATFKVIG